ncbi:hypothetical protein T439DRAFT_325151 [Meredithblackwellia eburnea MCA 4105]
MFKLLLPILAFPILSHAGSQGRPAPKSSGRDNHLWVLPRFVQPNGASRWKAGENNFYQIRWSNTPNTKVAKVTQKAPRAQLALFQWLEGTGPQKPPSAGTGIYQFKEVDDKCKLNPTITPIFGLNTSLPSIEI